MPFYSLHRGNFDWCVNIYNKFMDDDDDVL